MGWIERILRLLLSPQVFAPLIYPGIVTILAVIIFMLWLERKIAAKVQLRYGPLYVLKRLGGIIQLIADLLRFLFAHPIIPEAVDKLAFVMGPILLFALVYLPAVALPVSSGFVAISSDLNLLLALALIVIGPIFVLILGWASNNKFSLIGGLREGYLMMAYEMPLFITVLSMAVVYNSFDLVEIVERQAGGHWGVLLNPLAAVLFLLIAFMSTSRYPFEIAEAESELVMGPYTEYSGILYGLTMGASYVKLYVLSLLFTEVFLGGWYPTIWPLNTHPILPGLVVLGKALVVMSIGVFLRAVYPRYRIDQGLKIGWHVFFSLSIASLLLSLGIVGIRVLG